MLPSHPHPQSRNSYCRHTLRSSSSAAGHWRGQGTARTETLTPARRNTWSLENSGKQTGECWGEQAGPKCRAKASREVLGLGHIKGQRKGGRQAMEQTLSVRHSPFSIIAGARLGGAFYRSFFITRLALARKNYRRNQKSLVILPAEIPPLCTCGRDRC